MRSYDLRFPFAFFATDPLNTGHGAIQKEDAQVKSIKT
jgi:hypothetical protein